MLVAVPKEKGDGERRVALVPEVVKRLAGRGIEVLIESGAGEEAMLPDSLYEQAGAKIGTAAKVWASPFVVKVAPPSAAEIGKLGAGAILIGFLAPLSSPETTKALA